MTKRACDVSLPTLEEVAADLEGWTSLRDHLDHMVPAAKRDIRRKMERRDIAGESVEDCIERAKKDSEWIWETRNGGRVHIEDVACINDDCWYIRHADSIGVDCIDEYITPRRLRGTDDVYLCDRCYVPGAPGYVRRYIQSNYCVDPNEHNLFKDDTKAEDDDDDDEVKTDTKKN